MDERRWAYRPLVPVVAALAGLLAAATAVTARGTDLRVSRSVDVAQLVVAKQRQVAAQTALLDRLRAQISAATAAAARRDVRVAAAERAAGLLYAAAGLTALVGPAVTVSLDDARRLPAGRSYPGNPTPDDLVIHQQDVQGVVNALWTGGAEAMTIMGQRVVATTAVRCVGNTLLLLGVVYSPPFVITAIGDPARLETALDADPDVQIFRQYVAAYGLGYRVGVSRRTTLPGYSGPLELSSARALP